MKKSIVWMALWVVAAGVWLAGCNNAPAETEASTSDSASSAAATSQNSTASAPVEADKKTEPAAATTEATKKADPEQPKVATADPAKATEKPKDDSAEKTEAEQAAIEATAKADAAQGVKNLGEAKRLDGKPSNVRAEPAGKPTPAIPPSANRSATQQNFVGTWKREIDADLRKKYESAIAAQKKRGKKTYPIDNVMVVKADGTFTWDDNAGIVGRKVEGTWSVQNGEAKFKIVKVDGKAPSGDDTKEFKAMVSRDGKELFRNNNERNKFRKS